MQPIHLFLIATLITTTVSSTTRGTTGRLFGEQRVCPGKIVESSHCTVQAETKTSAECGLRCSGDAGCQSFHHALDTGLCSLCDQTAFHNCSNTQDGPGRVAYEEITPCGSRKILIPDTNRCECARGIEGPNCEQVMTDCGVYESLGRGDGVYWVRPGGEHSEAFQVYCAFFDQPHTYVMMHYDKEFSFNRTWAEYVNGFGDLAGGDFWLGLKQLSALTGSKHYCLGIQFNRKGAAGALEAVYDAIFIDDQSQDFALRFGNYLTAYPDHPLNDCLSAVRNRPFSTWDRDNDGVTENCAARHQSGWWMGDVGGGASCTLCNPTGVLLSPDDETRENVDQEVFWTPYGLGTFSPQSVEMWLISSC